MAQLGGARVRPSALPLRPFQGALPWPAAGIVTSRFGRQKPTAASAPRIARNGIEIALGEGQTVRAVHEGVVAYADQFTGYGNLVIVDHGDGAYSLYGYLIVAGRRPGRPSSTPRRRLAASGRNPSGNPALYFELRVDGSRVDPLQWLKR